MNSVEMEQQVTYLQGRLEMIKELLTATEQRLSIVEAWIKLSETKKVR